jgi:hypothetical protein
LKYPFHPACVFNKIFALPALGTKPFLNCFFSLYSSNRYAVRLPGNKNNKYFIKTINGLGQHHKTYTASEIF